MEVFLVNNFVQDYSAVVSYAVIVEMEENFVVTKVVLDVLVTFVVVAVVVSRLLSLLLLDC